MSNLLIFLQSLNIDPRRASVAHGGEYHSSCPACGDGGKGRSSDRFHIWPEKPNRNNMCVGRYWCRQCDISGDTIDFLVRFYNMDFKAACTELGIRLENGGRSEGYRMPATPQVPAALSDDPREYPPPCSLWSEKAEAFLQDCTARLLEDEEALEWLAARGIDREMAEKYRLGFNKSSRGGDRYRPRSVWGVPDEQNEKGQKKKLWLPKGWVIPMLGSDGTVLQLRIRRLDEDIKKFCPNIKYLVVKGSSLATMVLHPRAEVHAIVESGFDAILIAGMFGGRIGAVTTWNSSARPDTHATKVLKSSQCILNCLDYDDAGANAQEWWEKNFRRHKRWPVPDAKDPGDAYQQGTDIRAWMLAGVPAGLQLKVENKDLQPEQKEEVAPTPVVRKDDPVPQVETAPPEEEMIEIEKTLPNGQTIYIVDNQKLWEKLADEGKTVFSKNELERLGHATATMSQEDQLEAVMKIVMFKEVFGKAYIYDGRSENNGRKSHENKTHQLVQAGRKQPGRRNYRAGLLPGARRRSVRVSRAGRRGTGGNGLAQRAGRLQNNGA